MNQIKQAWNDMGRRTRRVFLTFTAFLLSAYALAEYFDGLPSGEGVTWDIGRTIITLGITGTVTWALYRATEADARDARMKQGGRRD